MKIFVEKMMAPHDSAVYASEGVAGGVSGWDAVDEAAVERYEEDGFLLVRDAIPREVVEAAVAELQGMREADDPDCQGVYFEGLMRGWLGLSSFDPDLPDTPQLTQLAMSEAVDSLAELPREARIDLVRKFMGFVVRRIYLWLRSRTTGLCCGRSSEWQGRRCGCFRIWR